MQASRERQPHLDAKDVAAESATGTGDAYGAMTAEVTAFFGRLRHVPADAWFRSAAADGHIVAKLRPGATLAPAAIRLQEARADERARARLRDVMDTMPAIARRIRRRIDEELAVLDGITTVATLTQMRRAARIAACAIAARPFLSEAEFERLYRPFATIVPPGTLGPH